MKGLGFHELNISRELLEAIKMMGFEEPTPVQALSIPPALREEDVMAQAQTGTGKTAAFGIPIVQRCNGSSRPFALVLSPTRELAIQIAEELNKIGLTKRIKALPVYGGQSIDRQIRALRGRVNIIVGTPGRLLDHIQRGTIELNSVRVVVLDEADEMLNMGFIDDIEKILSHTPKDRQTMLFSATIPAEIERIARRYMKRPTRITVDPKSLVVSSVRQVFYEVRHEDKLKALARLIDSEDPYLTLVFCHTKREVDEVSRRLQQMGYLAGAIHGDFTQAHRETVMRKFRSRAIDILVATDVAARGIDIPDVSHVINYSIPQNPDSYVHRIGRTGRAGRSGIAITFITPREYRQLRLIERATKTRILKAELPTKQQVLKARKEELLEDLREILQEGDYTGAQDLMETLTGEYIAQEVALAAIKLLLSYIDIDDEPDNGDLSYTRLFMNIGRREELRPSDLVRFISDSAGIDVKYIGHISIKENFSFIEVSEVVVEKVLSALDRKSYKGRRLAVQRARR